MRWLRITRTRGTTEHEHGGISVITALLMVVLLAFAALAIDVGVLYSERAQLQNGADAAAIAIAQKCAEDEEAVDCTASTSDSSMAKGLADANALDSVSNVSNVELHEEAGKVTVTTGAEDIDGSHKVSLFFANILGIADAEVGAQASAAWGSPIAGTVFPMIFSECEVDLESGSLQQVTFRKGDNGQGCPGGPPGGFGKIDQTAGECGADVSIENPVGGSKPGNSMQKDFDACHPLLDAWMAEIEDGDDNFPLGFFPVYNKVNDQGKNATYDVSGLTAFEIHGWKFKQGGSNKKYESFRANDYPDVSCGDDICLIGKFVKMVALDSEFEIGPPDNFGISIVRLTA